MISRPCLLAVLGVALLVGACADRSRPPSPPTSRATTTSASMPVDPAATGRAHALVIQATSCWLGGLWSDALGEREDARTAGIIKRCLEVVQAVGDTSRVSYYPLRALDAETVGHIAEHVRAVAATDENDAPHAAELASLLTRIADASRESMHARRAADELKAGYDSSLSVEDRRAAKLAAAPPLRASRGLAELLAYRGPYEADARSIGLLMVVDRMEIARGLPKHLKIYAVEGAFSDVFGVSAPPLSEDAAQPIPTGTWLAYLTRVAGAAGHPVPPEARNPQNREPFAWSGALEGLADRLRGLHADPALERVADAVTRRLDHEAKGVRAAFDALAPEMR
ncbi:MAG: hypothetical protein KF764_14155 [Labilithrix sp.]|nr:hypothetical protein [Labilithrix sp.]